MNHLTLSRLAIVAGLSLCSLAAQAQSSAFSALYVFGDSLSDGGNNNLAFGGLTGPNPSSGTFIPSLPYATGIPGVLPTYSNGRVWVNSFASGLGLPGSAAPSLAGGGNYAHGGARTTLNGDPPLNFPPSVQTQLNAHLSTTAVSSSALYVIAGGGNDVRDTIGLVAADPANIVALATAGATAYATATAQMVNTLFGAGAGRVVVWNVPNVGLSPAALAGGPAAAGAASFVSSVYNSALSTALASTNAQIFDLAGLVGGYVANPTAFGFTNVNQACGFTGNNCDPATALFWDAIHPTAYTQTLVAGAMLAAVPEPSTVWLFMAGLVGFGVLARRRRAG